MTIAGSQSSGSYLGSPRCASMAVGVVWGSFLKASLIDEISYIVVSVADGRLEHRLYSTRSKATPSDAKPKRSG
jgi:hypothetical protein